MCVKPMADNASASSGPDTSSSVNACPVNAGAGGSRSSSSNSTDRIASTAARHGSDWRNTSLNTSSDSGPAYPVDSTCPRNVVRSNAPCPGNSRWCLLHCSTSMCSRGASASCRKKIFSPGIVRMAARSVPRERTWKLSRHTPSAGWSPRRTMRHEWS